MILCNRFEASLHGHLTIYQNLHNLCARSKSHFTSGSSCMTSQQIPISIQRKSCNILETLSNLLYLAEMDADDPQKVRAYVSLSRERIREMIQLIIGKQDGRRQPIPFRGDSLKL